MDYTVAIQLCHAPSFPTQLAHTEATYFQSHTCSHDTVYKETTLTCPNQQMTWHVARHWRKKTPQGLPAVDYGVGRKG